MRQSRKERPELLYPDPPTTHHHNLASFVAYAERTGLDVASTVYVGTHYEYTVSATLSQYGIQAARVGGASDKGIDLLGTWDTPSQNEPLKVILQCKGGAQRAGPSLVRELEGSFIGAPVGWRGDGVVAFLVSEKTASKGVREALVRSRWPMGFVSCSRNGIVQQMLWNQRAEEGGLRGMGVTMRHAEAGNSESQIVLTYNGKRVRSVSKTKVLGT
ncbi:conserved fungal protein [Colletotrichum tofieldiae]|nr:conserved fungal protein [Colletotrichum tofieldiae]GKT80201.1 conserved fungal protein [Colletotrichum tofieldiae]